MRVAIYTRVSTDEQTTENQKQALIEVAVNRDWDIVKIFEDYLKTARTDSPNYPIEG